MKIINKQGQLAGSVGYKVFTQVLPTASIVFRHGLNRYPPVRLTDLNGVTIWGRTQDLDKDRVQVDFGSNETFIAIFG
jgi:hypothetical protein